MCEVYQAFTTLIKIFDRKTDSYKNFDNKKVTFVRLWKKNQKLFNIKKVEVIRDGIEIKCDHQ